MKNLENILFYFVVAFVVQSCIWSAYNEELTDGYFLSAIDVKSDMEIIFSDGQDYMFAIIGPTVFAVGQNDEFIIAKQHPKTSSNTIDKSITNFFIIPISEKVNGYPQRNIFGPLTKEEFDKMREDLGIERLDFSIVFPELE